VVFVSNTGCSVRNSVSYTEFNFLFYIKAKRVLLCCVGCPQSRVCPICRGLKSRRPNRFLLLFVALWTTSVRRKRLPDDDISTIPRFSLFFLSLFVSGSQIASESIPYWCGAFVAENDKVSISRFSAFCCSQQRFSRHEFSSSCAIRDAHKTKAVTWCCLTSGLDVICYKPLLSLNLSCISLMEQTAKWQQHPTLGPRCIPSCAHGTRNTTT
jgi:hypothetical protein